MSDQSKAAPVALVAEDDGLIRMDIADILGTFGFDVLEAENGDEAMNLLAQQHAEVSLLFSDVDMPGSRNGFALAREVAATWPDIAIVIASGHLAPGPGDMPDGAKFIGKPFTAEMVRDHLRDIMPDHEQPRPLKET